MELQGLRRLSGHFLKDFAEAHCASLGLAPEEAFQQQTSAAKAFRQVRASLPLCQSASHRQQPACGKASQVLQLQFPQGASGCSAGVR